MHLQPCRETRPWPRSRSRAGLPQTPAPRWRAAGAGPSTRDAAPGAHGTVGAPMTACSTLFYSLQCPRNRCALDRRARLLPGASPAGARPRRRGRRPDSHRPRPARRSRAEPPGHRTRPNRMWREPSWQSAPLTGTRTHCGQARPHAPCVLPFQRWQDKHFEILFFQLETPGESPAMWYVRY